MTRLSRSDRAALHGALAEHVHAPPPLGCPILGILAVGADGLAIGATTASLDAALARRMPAGFARRGTWPLAAASEDL